MALLPVTLQTYEHLKDSKWYERGGTRYLANGPITSPVVIAASWKDAAKYSESSEWELAINESSNMFTAKLHKEASEAYKSWNDKAREVRSLVIPLVTERMEPIEREYNLSPILGQLVQAQISMVLMEAEFAHLIGAGNFSKLAFWFVNGHVPCGWKGEFPNGNLIIY